MIIIKSQDGEEIRKVDNIWIYQRKIGVISLATTTNDNIGILATYPTKERVQEVLDEIWKKIKNESSSHQFLLTYEMPKE